MALTTVTGDHATGADQIEAYTTDVPDVHVSLAGEDRANGDEYGGATARCARCDRTLTEDDTDVDGGTWEVDCPDDETGNADEPYGPHSPIPIPLSWANSAWIRSDESGDRIMVGISVGDPRGALVMSVERIRYTADDGSERDELRVSVPSPEDTMPHVGLAPLSSPGYYRVTDR